MNNFQTIKLTRHRH